LAERAPQARIRPVLTTVSRHHPPSWTRWTLVRCVQNKCWKATVDRYGPRYHAQVTGPNTKSRWTWHYISAPRIILAPKSSTKTMTRSAGRRFNCSSRVMVSGAYERHVRSIRRRNAERRAVLLQALADEFGSAVTVVGAETGLHVVAWFDGIAAEHEPALIADARAAGIGLYPVAPLYDPTEARPSVAGLVLGYAGLDADALRRGVAVLATVGVKNLTDDPTTNLRTSRRSAAADNSPRRRASDDCGAEDLRVGAYCPPGARRWGPDRDHAGPVSGRG
jgi:hypothetical protein